MLNQNSYICRLISENTDNWENILNSDYNVRVKKEGSLAIFNYSYNSDFSNPIVQEARGIIIDTDLCEVVCWPFRKFGNHNESYVDKIDWSTARVLEKIDGSIIKLWYDKQQSEWRFSTNKTISANAVFIEANPGLSFDALIKNAENYGAIPYSALDKDMTYIFELISPENPIVIHYDRTYLYHIGTRNNITGVEIECDIGIEKPKQYPISSLEGCIKAAAALNINAEKDVTNEGFVVVDGDFKRIKVKSMDYIYSHHAQTLTAISKRECIEMLLNHKEKIELISEKNFGLLPAIKFYEYKLAEVAYEASRIGKFAKNLFEEYGCERAAVAPIISKHRLAGIAFKCLDTGKDGAEVFLALPSEKIAKYIPDYVYEDTVSSLKDQI